LKLYILVTIGNAETSIGLTYNQISYGFSFKFGRHSVYMAFPFT
jgi:hypothetical protein